MGEKKYNNSRYHMLTWMHFKLMWYRCDNKTSAYGVPYDKEYSGYNLERIREVKGVICGPKGEAMEYSREIRKILRKEGCNPSMERLKSYLDGMLDSAIDEEGKPSPGPPYYGWR